MNERLAFDTALAPVDLARLQTWFSPAFPVGAFSYSHGLEWAIESGDVTNGHSLVRWIEGLLRHGSGRSDLILLGEAWRAVCSGDWSRLGEVKELAAALQPTQERRLESLGQGTAFVSAVAAGWPHPTLDQFERSFPGETALPVAVGLAAAAHGLPLAPVLTASLHAFTANLISAGLRLVPLGQTDGLRALAALEPVVLEVSLEARDLGLEDLGSASFLADIGSMCHETQYTRLFRS
ncbi:MAG: urease accessory protein UreF [Burkholderiaceae bacterium]